jgi:hypothetical protein
LSEYVTYEKTRQYEKLYELLYERNDKNACNEVYSKSRVETEGRRGVIQEFTPTSIIGTTLNEGDAPTFSLTGEAKVLLKGRTVKKEMSIRQTSRRRMVFLRVIRIVLTYRLNLIIKYFLTDRPRLRCFAGDSVQLMFSGNEVICRIYPL